MEIKPIEQVAKEALQDDIQLNHMILLLGDALTLENVSGFKRVVPLLNFDNIRQVAEVVASGDWDKPVKLTYCITYENITRASFFIDLDRILTLDNIMELPHKNIID